MFDQRAPSENYKITFGSNIFEDTKSTITWEEKEEILRFRDGGDMKLLVDCTVMDDKDRTIAKIAVSNLQYIDESCEFQKLENGVIVKDKATGVIILEFRQLGTREVKINGIFHIKGYTIDASDERLIIGKNGKGPTLIRNRFVHCKKGIVLRSGSLGLCGN